jgi:uncharacterized protein (TIGR02246 family)
MKSSDKDQDQIRKVFEEDYSRYVQSSDLEGYISMYTEDALWMPPDAIDRCGICEIEEGFNASIANKGIDPTFTAEEIEVMGDFGYVLGISDAIINGGPPSGQIKKFRALWLMKKENDQWKIDRQIWNNKPL